MCIIFSSSGFAENTQRQAIKSKSNFVSSKAIGENKFPNTFRPIRNWFKRILGKRKEIIEGGPADVTNLDLSQTEIVEICLSVKLPQKTSCSNSSKLIEVSTEAFDSQKDSLTYKYKVSGGKIVGEGAKVIWDLSDVRAGTYTIVAGVDDGCGVCGKTITKEIKVLECRNCN